MLKAFSGAAALAAEFARLLPCFAGEIGAVEHWIATGTTASRTLPPTLLGARRAATAEEWSHGVARWNRGATERLALLRRLPPDPTLVLACLDLLAADFGDQRWPRGLDASGAIFPGHLVLERATLDGPLRLDAAQCLASVRAGGAAIAGDLTAEEARFTGPAQFDGVRVGRASRFPRATFQSDATFDGAVVERELWMRGARFGGAFRMVEADLRHDASLGCVYAGPARFDRTRFADTVSFENAIFNGSVSCNGCRFDGVVLLEGVEVLADASSIGAAFNGGARPSADPLRKGRMPRDLTMAVQRAFSR